jgi:16S rRNA processing protein RimM
MVSRAALLVFTLMSIPLRAARIIDSLTVDGEGCVFVEEPEVLTVASIVKPQGNRGEVIAELLTDFPERFQFLQKLSLYKNHSPVCELELTEHWFHKGRVVLKFQGIDSISAAETLRGLDVVIPRHQAIPLPEGSYYEFELKGCQVKSPTGDEYGIVEELIRSQGQVLLRVLQPGRDFLIPFVTAFFLKIDVRQKEIICDLPEGLLSL